MNEINHSHEVFGVDRAVIEAAMQRARRERSKALWALVRSVFGGREAGQAEAKLASSQSGTPAHC